MLSGCGIFCEEASRHVDDDFAEYEEDTFDEVEGFDSAGRFEYMFVSNDDPGEAKEEPRAAPAADVPRRSSRFCCARPRPAPAPAAAADEFDEPPPGPRASPRRGDGVQEWLDALPGGDRRAASAVASEAERRGLGRPNPLCALRWARNHGLDASRAAAAYGDHCAWRKAEAVDGLEREHASLPPMRRRTLERLYFYDPPHSEQLHDRRGRPIKVFATSRLDKAGMRAAGVDTAALARYHLLHMERLRRGREDRRPVLGDPSLGILEIFDVKDATISLFRRSFDEIIACARINESRYPGLVGITLIVNAPATFGYCYAFVKPFLSYETQRRIEVVPGDPRKRIGELVDDANIPREAYRLSPDGRP